jgi:Peptidase family M1 domain
MEGRRGRAAGAALVVLALSGVSAGTALASPHVTVGSLSSLKAGATHGTLRGTVVNRTSRATDADVTVRVMRYGTKAKIVGAAKVHVGANANADYRVAVRLPASLSRGNYYLSACTPSGTGHGELGCATSERDIAIKGGTPVRGPKAQLPARRTGATAASAEDCSAGVRTLENPGDRVFPELGNGGYKSVHSDVYINYDAIANQFLSGTHVDLQQRSTQCLSEFSLDFDRKNNVSDPKVPGPDFAVSSVTVNGQPATFEFKQPTYPGDPNGQDDPDPLAHRTGLTIPISADNPNPPACAPTSSSADAINVPCPATKLVITPSAPIPSGTDFTVTVNYTGRPGVRNAASLGTEGWFRNDTPGGEGAMVTSEPSGTMAWMPLNNHASVKPTYDIYDTVTKGKLAIGNGRLISTGDNAPDANFPGGSTSWHWKSSEPIAGYLVENSVGSFDWNERVGANGVVYFEAQDSAIVPDRKVRNKAAMDQQEDITHFQEGFNGPFPFNADGIVVALPRASFEEEMQTKIVFVGGTIGGNGTTPNVGTFAHENMHQWWGDNVSYANPKYTFFKEGQATTAEYFNTARLAANAAGGQGTAAGDAAFERSIVTSFNTQYATGQTANTANYWTVAPSNPTSASLFGNSNTYTRPGISYVALRAILGKDNYTKVLKELQTTYGGGSVTEAQVEAVFHKYLPNQSADCSARLDEFFKQWWDTAYPPGGGVNKPSITGPGLNGTNFYNSQGGCTNGVGGTVPATLSLTLGTPAAFGVFTPGLAHTYTASTSATVISTAGDATLSVSDPSTVAPGHLVNGAFSLPSPLKASATSPGGTGAAGGAVSGSPLTLLTYDGPISNDAVAIAFSQDIGANDALRTGTYGKTLTFTLSTTTP